MTDDDRMLSLFKKLADEMKIGDVGEDLSELIQAAQQDPDRRVGRYLLLDEIGSGGAGKVYRAWHPDLKRCCAMKVLAADTDDQRMRLKREAQIAAQLSHPCIITVHEVGEHRDTPYIVMEYVDGPTLGQLRMTPREALEVMRAIAEAVHFAHERGVLHRDLKPANILLGRDGRPRITDFGLARQTQRGGTITAPGTVVGTPAYLAPEVAAGGATTARSDVYGLGATLYSLLAGAPPYEGVSVMEILQKVGSRDPVALRTRVPSINRDVETIVAKAMAREPERRYASAHALAEDIGRYLEGRAILARSESVLLRARRALSRNRAAAVLAALLAVCACVALVLLVRWERERRRMAAEAAAREARQKKVSALLDKAATGLQRAEAIQYAANGTLTAVRDAAEKATALLNEAIVLEPTNAAANSMMGRALALMSRPKDALKHFSAALKTEPTLFSALWGRGCIYLSHYVDHLSHRDCPAHSELEEVRRRALRDLRAAAEAGTTGWEFAFAQASVAFAEERYDDALRLCQGASGGDPSAVDLHLLAARAHLVQKHPAEAVACCDEALRLRPGYYRARITRGDALFHQRHYAKAAEDLERGLQFDDSGWTIWNKLGMALQDTGDYDRALQAYDRAVTLNPDCADALSNRAVVRMRKGDLEKALQDATAAIEKAKEGSRNAILYYTNRIAVYDALGEKRLALRDAEMMVARFPDNPESYSRRGWRLLLMHDNEAAEKDCETALRMDAHCVDALLLESTLRFSQMRFEEAVTAAERALELEPDNARAFAARGYARSWLGDEAGARDDWGKASSLDADLRKTLAHRLREEK